MKGATIQISSGQANAAAHHPLSHPESKRLAELERKIDQGEKTFVEVGLALCEIRDQRLYRNSHPTFEDYCRAKWDFTRQHGNQIIAAAVTVKSLPQDLETIVSNVGQARALVKVLPEKRVTVLKLAHKKAEGRKMTARDIQSANAPESKDGPEASQRVPRSAARSQKGAHQWWYKSATPERRGEFLSALLTTWAKPVAVSDVAELRARFERFITEHVR